MKRKHREKPEYLMDQVVDQIKRTHPWWAFLLKRKLRKMRREQ